MVENTGGNLFIQESIEILYLSLIVGEENRKFLELRDPSLQGVRYIPTSHARPSTASITRSRNVPVRWEHKCRGGAVFLTKERDEIRRDVTRGEVLSLRDPAAVI